MQGFSLVSSDMLRLKLDNLDVHPRAQPAPLRAAPNRYLAHVMSRQPNALQTMRLAVAKGVVFDSSLEVVRVASVAGLEARTVVPGTVDRLILLS